MGGSESQGKERKERRLNKGEKISEEGERIKGKREGKQKGVEKRAENGTKEGTGKKEPQEAGERTVSHAPSTPLLCHPQTSLGDMQATPLSPPSPRGPPCPRGFQPQQSQIWGPENSQAGWEGGGWRDREPGHASGLVQLGSPLPPPCLRRDTLCDLEQVNHFLSLSPSSADRSICGAAAVRQRVPG